MFLTVSGEVAIVQGEAAQPIQQLHRGDFFGEIALVQRSRRIASAVAVSSCEVLVVGRQEFDVLYRRSSSFRQAVRLTAELRLEANVARHADPELVWLVNETRQPGEQLARLVADALSRVVGTVAPPRALEGPEGVEEALAAGDRDGSAYVVCFSGPDLEQRFGRHVADRAGGVVYVTRDPASHFPYPSTFLHRVHHVVVPTEQDSAEPRHLRRDAFMLPLSSRLGGATVARLPDDAQTVLLRLARSIAHRRVGVALGGGAAWGYAHVVLLRGLAGAGIPVDIVVGVSAGSLVGAFYASQGLDGLDRFVARGWSSPPPRSLRSGPAPRSTCSCAGTSRSGGWRSSRCRSQPWRSRPAPGGRRSSGTARSPPPSGPAARSPASLAARCSAVTAISTAA